MDVNDRTFNRRQDSNCPSARSLAEKLSDSEARFELSAYVWKADNETGIAMHACHIKLQLSPQRCPESDHCLIDPSVVHWIRHLLTIKLDLGVCGKLLVLLTNQFPSNL